MFIINLPFLVNKVSHIIIIIIRFVKNCIVDVCAAKCHSHEDNDKSNTHKIVKF